MSTAFLQVKNDAASLVATAPSPANSGTSLVVTSSEGANFNAPGNGFWATIWDAVTYSEPRLDPNREIVKVTARSTDTFTIVRAQQGTAARTVVVGDAIRRLWTAADVDAITGAINTTETSVATLQGEVGWKSVGDTGCDYTDLATAVTAGFTNLYVKGTLTIAANVSISTSNVCIWSNPSGQGTIVLNNVADLLALSGTDSGFTGITFDVNSTTNLGAATTAWIALSGTRNYITNCTFLLDGMTTATTGNLITCAGSTLSKVADNYFFDGRKLRSLITLGANNRQGVYTGNTFMDFQDISVFFADVAGTMNPGLIANNFMRCAGMADAKNVIHLNSSGAGNIPSEGAVVGNVLICTGTFDEATRTGIFVNGVGGTTTTRGGFPITGNFISDASGGFASFGMTLTTTVNMSVTGNVCGTVRAYSNIGFNFTGNNIYSYNANNNTADQSQINNNFIRGATINLGTFKNSSFSGNIGDKSNPITATMGSSSFNSVITGNTGTALTIDGSYHVVTGNTGYGSTSAGEYTGALTVNGNYHYLSNNRFASITNTNSTSVIDGRIKIDITGHSNSSTTETDLTSYTVKGGALWIDGDALEVKASGIFAANGNNKTVQLYWAGSSILTSTAVAVNGGAWEITATIMRTGATTQEINAKLIYTDGSNVTTTKVSRTAGSATLSSDNICKTTATSGTASTDVTQEMFEIKYYSAQ